jgi:hypothetical protein
MGRLTLVRRGFVDLRAGYDFYHATVRNVPEIEDTNDPDPGSSRAPHGPRMSLDLGLVAEERKTARWFHGFGLGLGYRALVGSFSRSLPTVHLLSLGLVYWLG